MKFRIFFNILTVNHKQNIAFTSTKLRQQTSRKYKSNKVVNYIYKLKQHAATNTCLMLTWQIMRIIKVM